MAPFSGMLTKLDISSQTRRSTPVSELGTRYVDTPSEVSLHYQRCQLVWQGPSDLDDDITAGFKLIHAFDIDDLGVPEVVRRIKERIGNSPVVISLDVDVMDPSTAPASLYPLPTLCKLPLTDVCLIPAGTPESGGWTSRELRRIIQSLQGLNVVAFDIVELSPAYDTNGESFVSLMVDIHCSIQTRLIAQPKSPLSPRLTAPTTSCVSTLWEQTQSW